MALSYPKEPIAIIGSGCRFPGGATSPGKLWELLRDPRDVLCEIPPDRFHPGAFYHRDGERPGYSNVKHSYLLEEDVAQFDAQFFSIQPAEASAMDPQQRLLLEVVYEGIEAAGLTLEGLRGSDTGVYVGVMFGDYELMQVRDLQHLPTYQATGNARSILSNRLSYFFDWRGPSMTIDTACSSSLVALHQAVQALRVGEAKIAVAAGANILLGPEPYISESNLKMLSPEGRSRMWDAAANGYARGEGFAAVVLKPLSAALRDGDHIECIVRETGVNQDGRSHGITMPSADAQAALIQETYARAGLDPRVDPCQYFEAHGTGTPAGDPVEAEAIHRAFFGEDGHRRLESPQLLVGSIKTIIGHTEGAAGLAAVLKAAQALQHGKIPANLLLNRLNPAIQPFYNDLRIPQDLTTWPELGAGLPRRVSVNSFGFGGANAHAILESMDHLPTSVPPTSSTGRLSARSTPFLFSAQSKQSLQSNLAQYIEYLEANPDTSITDLAWTLRSRRSRLPLRVSFPASSVEGLRSNLQEFCANPQFEQRASVSKNDAPRFLGVFTGQGAQYARMGAELVETSMDAANVLASLDAALAELPQHDRPGRTLRYELLAEGQASNVGSATVSQPLCTALQIILVEMLRKAGIEFAAVIGHSSGEIGAAYAAGVLSARDAIRIAHYRGLHSHLAGGAGAVQGAMLAVGTTLEDAEELCQEFEFRGKATVAACNSPTSVTISGDKDIIEWIAAVFTDEGKFVRMLKVDKAYHSHHMQACSQPYLGSMSASAVTMKTPHAGCAWVSSVYPNRSPEQMADLPRSYWVDNLVSPVLFRQAVEGVMALGPFDAAIEVGPHPALKGPVLETMQGLKTEIPYTGLLQRGKCAIESMSMALGYLWVHLDNCPLDWDAYEAAISGVTLHHYISALPSYQWNHGARYWHESKLSANLRQRSIAAHPLLGDLCPTSSRNRLIWKHLLRQQDLPWLSGHRIQGQVVFPGAAYAVTALEVVPYFTDMDVVKLVELTNLRIHQAMPFDNDDHVGTDVQVVVDINRDDPDCITAAFTYEAMTGGQGSSFSLVASAEIAVTTGEPSPDVLPAADPGDGNMLDIETDAFYNVLKDLGYGYTGPFRALSRLRRKYGQVLGSATVPSTDGLLLHPALLDAAFHSIFLALSYPGDGEIWTLHLPTMVRHIRINPLLCRSLLHADHAAFVALIGDVNGAAGFEGDVEIQSPDGGFPAVQVEGMHVVPLTSASPADDKQLFFTVDWVRQEPDLTPCSALHENFKIQETAHALSRVAYFYLRRLVEGLTVAGVEAPSELHASYLKFALNVVTAGFEHTCRSVEPEWQQDTTEDINRVMEQYANLPDMRLLRRIGEHLPQAWTMAGDAEPSIVKELEKDGLLHDYWANGIGLAQMNEAVADAVAQINGRFPRMSVLEVSAGTGSLTRQILNRIGSRFKRYWWSHTSKESLNSAKSELQDVADIAYVVFDPSHDTQPREVEQHPVDVVVTSLLLNGVDDLARTMRSLRSVLRPGGYLIMPVLAHLDAIHMASILGCLPGSWLGMNDGKPSSLTIPESAWDSTLLEAGFSGLDTIQSGCKGREFPVTIMISQAIDDRVEFLREPLLSPSPFHQGQAQDLIKSLYIVGGASSRTSRLAAQLQRTLVPFCTTATQVKTVLELRFVDLTDDATILVLEDLDSPVFQDISVERFDAIKELFTGHRTILWVSQRRLLEASFTNPLVGFSRSVLWDHPSLRLQFLDFQKPKGIDARGIAEALLRLQAAEYIKGRGKEKSILWPIESEIMVAADRHHLVPRLRTLDGANARYNSARRSITYLADPQHSAVAVSATDRGYALHENAKVQDVEGAIVDLRVTHSSLHAIRSVIGDVILVLGTCASAGTRYLGLTRCPTSLVRLPPADVWPISVSPGQETAFLISVAAALITPMLLQGLVEGDVLLLHNAPPAITTSVRRQTDMARINLICTATSATVASENGWIHLAQYLSASRLRAVLPRNISRFADFTGEDKDLRQQPAIASYLPVTTEKIYSRDLFARVPINTLPTQQRDDGKANDIMEQAIASALEELETSSSPTRSIKIADLQKSQNVGDPLTVVEWTASALELSVKPINVEFRPDRTYWLVGLSGELGLSITDWMIACGARYVVITSRNPKIGKSWLESSKRQGASVHVLSCDVTNLESVQKTYRLIAETLPRVAGVVQGAMLLDDVATENMTVDQLTRVLRPKVDGSINLDRVFHDHELDFFVFFSSTASIVGNVGQANYCAANVFMSGVAQERRHRGVAGSVLDLGLVVGTGVATRELGAVGIETLVQERGLISMSEADVHTAFAEAVKCSRPDSGTLWQVVCGLQQLAEDSPKQLWCYSMPQFAALTITNTNQDPGSSPEQDKLPIKDRLANATTDDDILAIISETLAAELRSTLRVGEDFEITDSLRTDELGLDSLIAVRIRSWFLNNYQANIPALKIMQGITLRELAEYTLENMPKELVPLVSDGGADCEDSTETEEKDDSSSSSAASPQELTPPSSSHSDVYLDREPLEEKSTEDLDIERVGPLSHTQRMMMFVHELLDNKTSLNNTGFARLEGYVRVSDLALAIRTVAQRHEALRTRIRLREGGFVQEVLRTSQLRLETREISSTQEARDICDSLHQHIYDPQSGNTVRILLLTLSSREHYLLIGFHHSVFDAMSHDPVMAEVQLVYQGQTLSHPPTQFLDFSNDQHYQYESGKFQTAVAFWREEFFMIPDPLPLRGREPTERQPLKSYSSYHAQFTVDANLSKTIREVAKRYRATPFHVYLAAFKTLLYRFLGVQDICISMMDNQRRTEQLRAAVGPFLTMLPLRLQANADETRGDAIMQARAKSQQALANSLPMEVILNELRVPRTSTHAPLAQAAINYIEDSMANTQRYLGGKMEVLRREFAELGGDFTLNLLPRASGETPIVLHVQRSFYTQQDAELLVQGYEDILREFSAAPGEKIGAEWRYRESLLQKTLTLGRGPQFTPSWSGPTLSHRFHDLFPALGERVAVTDSDHGQLTYRQLSVRVDAIATELLRRGAGPDSRIAILQEPQQFMVASVLAVMKIGGVYVPLDPGIPVERLLTIVSDSQPTTILAHRDTLEIAARLRNRFAILDVATLTRPPTQPVIAVRARADAPALILYTSGSTGTPKGVLLSHGSLYNKIARDAAEYGVAEDDVMLQQSTWTFDISTWQCFMPLAVGARLHIVPRHVRVSWSEMANVIRSQGITMSIGTPTEYKAWLRRENWAALRESRYRLALTCGEPVPESLLELVCGLDQPGFRLFNVYGPTETTISTGLELNFSAPDHYTMPIPVGPALANESIYILSEAQTLLPVGQTGEVAIAGVGVAMGYLNNDTQMQASFLPNPFAPPEYVDRGWKIMYRTGDRGYLREDGTLIVKGRIQGDTEVKINGVRINLREIEAAVLGAAQGCLADAVATVRASADEARCFVVVHVVLTSSDDHPGSQIDLQDLLHRVPLPPSVRPAVLLPLEVLPRVASGKIDRRALASLPIPDMGAEAADSDSALSETELELRGLWYKVIPEELVGVNAISATSDFFTVGGSSLQLIDLQAKIQEHFHVQLALLELFQSSDLRSMARALALPDCAESSSPQLFDWAIETALQPTLADISIALPGLSRVARPARVVVVTGATGFLGQYLVQSLVADPNIQRVICIGVRNLQDASRAALRQMDKVECYEGDLRLPRLGLSEVDATRVFSQADALVHNGADVSHVKTYASLRTPNSESTRSLVELCLPRRVPFHYISTIGVVMHTTVEIFHEASLRDLPPPVDGHYGYAASKWVSEVYLEAVHERYGLPVTIHRPSSILRPNRPSDFQHADNTDAGTAQDKTVGADVIQDLMAYSKRIGAVPNHSDRSGTIDFVYPETVTNGVLRELFREYRGARGVVFIHAAGDIEMEFSEVKGHLEEQTGTEIAEVSLTEWVERAEAAGLPGSLGAVFQGFEGSQQVNFPKIERRN